MKLYVGNLSEAKAAMNALNGKRVNGRSLTVNETRAHAMNPSGGGRGRY